MIQGYPLLPTTFNVVVDAVVCHLESLVAERAGGGGQLRQHGTASEQDGPGKQRRMTAYGGRTYAAKGEVRVFLRGKQDGGLYQPRVSQDRILYADGNLQPGGDEEKCQENCGDGMTTMPGSPGMGRQILYLAYDGGREELQGYAVGSG